jgi:A/G-specific adenine glycosylase
VAHRTIIRPCTTTILRAVDDRLGIPDAARAVILGWYAEHGRPLAFRGTRDPYAILVSEAMAQQTQAVRAAAYWERFMARFPTVHALAQAKPAEVLREWQGLGYDRRALALWRAAKAIVTEHGGRVPDSIEALEALPGVGPYTARAVAAIAFGRRVGAVDVNVRRVLGRMVGGSRGLPPRDIQAIADAAVPADDPGAWTHAVMDLGATNCRPRAPRCGDCPARAWCAFAAEPGATTAPTACARRATEPFPMTTRWLRGRILDRLREAADDTWVTLDGPIGAHDIDRVHRAASALAADGMLQLERDSRNVVHARLPTDTVHG